MMLDLEAFGLCSVAEKNFLSKIFVSMLVGTKQLYGKVIQDVPTRKLF